MQIQTKNEKFRYDSLRSKKKKRHCCRYHDNNVSEDVNFFKANQKLICLTVVRSSIYTIGNIVQFYWYVSP